MQENLLLPQQFISERDSSLRRILCALTETGQIDLHRQTPVLDVGAYTGTSRRALINFGCQDVTSIETYLGYVQLGIDAGITRPGEIINTDYMGFFLRDQRMFGLIAFFGAPKDFSTDHFLNTAMNHLLVGGAVVMTGYEGSLCNKNPFESVHAWDGDLLVVRKD